mmetsp:Transcript_3438/g.10099  ORF Transcript_3438/g.10099 Transcript_3438/m.10099 type:complete len:126 (-) Transcript_3438:56-433(-)
MPGHAHRITSEAFSPDGQRIVSGSQDCTVGIYACRPSEMNGHFNEVTSVAFLPDGQRIVLGSNGKSVRVWSPKGEQLREMRGHTLGVYSVAFCPTAIESWPQDSAGPVAWVRKARSCRKYGTEMR